MRAMRLLTAIAVMSALSACQDERPVVQVMPDQPRLAGAYLEGRRVCGDFKADDATFKFDCPDLPTQAATAWQLTPLQLPRKAGAWPHNANRFVRIDIITPPRTEIEVMANREAMHGVRAAPGVTPQRVIGGGADYTYAVSDAPASRTWHLTFRVSGCRAISRLAIANIAPDGMKRSSPLDVAFVRAAQETAECTVVDNPGSLRRN